MAFTGNYSCNTLRTGLATGAINFATDTFYLALYTNAATLDATTTSYTSTGESTGGNYSAGGQILTISQIPTIGNQTGNATSYLSFSDVSWTGAITARGALIYLEDGSTNPSVCVLDFGNDKTSTTTFTVQFPSATNTSAIIRIS